MRDAYKYYCYFRVTLCFVVRYNIYCLMLNRLLCRCIHLCVKIDQLLGIFVRWKRWTSAHQSDTKLFQKVDRVCLLWFLWMCQKWMYETSQIQKSNHCLIQTYYYSWSVCVSVLTKNFDDFFHSVQSIEQQLCH